MPVIRLLNALVYITITKMVKHVKYNFNEGNNLWRHGRHKLLPELTPVVTSRFLCNLRSG